MNQIVWEQIDSPAADDLAVIDNGLESSNRAAVDLENVRPLGCFARLTSGELVGGAIARTWGECCELQQLWVAPSYRRTGIGRRLIEMVLREARVRGCKLIYLESFSFQVPHSTRRLVFRSHVSLPAFPME